jgi:hypothetical protein
MSGAMSRARRSISATLAISALAGLGCAAPPHTDRPTTADAGTDGGATAGCGDWKVGTLTGYNNSSEDDDPNAGSLAEFTDITDAFYANVPIASVDSSDWRRDRYHFVDIRFLDKIGRVGVWDMCRNEDCPDGTDCCTDNKERFASPGYLLDLETRTAERLFDVQNAEDTLNDRIEYRICGTFDPDDIADRYGARREP